MTSKPAKQSRPVSTARNDSGTGQGSSVVTRDESLPLLSNAAVDGTGSSAAGATQVRQKSSMQTMKITKRGRPPVKDVHDLFCTLIISLDLQTHRHHFRAYPYTFSTDEAAKNLANLKFAQSNRVPDPNDDSRIITTTTTTTFMMHRDMAKSLCQHFMDARLIENAVDTSSNLFRDKSLYGLTPKGLHILERFITNNGIGAGESLLEVFVTQPICLKLLHLERTGDDDEILLSRGLVEVLFKRFAGKEPNIDKKKQAKGSRKIPLEKVSSDGSSDRGTSKHLPMSSSPATSQGQLTSSLFTKNERKSAGSDGVKLKERKRDGQTYPLTASSWDILDWLCDYTTIFGRTEAAEMAGQFVRHRLLAQIVSEDSDSESDSDIIVSAGGGRFVRHPKALYSVTDLGQQMAGWITAPTRQLDVNMAQLSLTNSADLGRRRDVDNDMQSQNSAGSHISTKSGPVALGIENVSATDSNETGFARNHARKVSESEQSVSEPAVGQRESNTKRLRQILDNPGVRNLFGEFLQSQFCEENLIFYLDVADFSRRFQTTSSASAGSKGKSGETPSPVSSAKKKLHLRQQSLQVPMAPHLMVQTALEKHQQDLISMAFVIYNTYLAPASPRELNIDHNLRTSLVSYMTKLLTDAATPESQKPALTGTIPLPAEQAPVIIQATHLNTILRLYERIQEHTFKIMATDSVPKFLTNDRIQSIMQSLSAS